MLSGLKLTEAEEPCPKCGCFWKEHKPATCRGVGTRDDNLWFTHEHFYPEVLTILKGIVENSGAVGKQPCPLCADKVDHDWLECVRTAQY